MYSSRQKITAGFTLIEMIVSLAIFSIIITMAIGALLALISNNQRLQGEQSVMTNLTFALDSMTREIRTGYNYVCDTSANDSTPINSLIPPSSLNPEPRIFDDGRLEHEGLEQGTKDCANGRNNERFNGISFYEGGDSITTGLGVNRIMYFYDATEAMIKRRVGNSLAQPIISSGLLITDAEFIVTGSTPQKVGNNIEQPTVTIFIEAKEISEDKIYRLQTTVTQRILDL